MPDDPVPCPQCGCERSPPVVKLKIRAFCGQILLCGVPSINPDEDGLYSHVVETINCDPVDDVVPPIDACSRITTWDYDSSGTGYIAADCLDIGSMACDDSIDVSDTCGDPDQPFPGCVGEGESSRVYSRRIDFSALPGAALGAAAGYEDTDWDEDIPGRMTGFSAGFVLLTAHQQDFIFKRFGSRANCYIKLDIANVDNEDSSDVIVSHQIITLPASSDDEVTYRNAWSSPSRSRVITGVTVAYHRMPSDW